MLGLCNNVEVGIEFLPLRCSKNEERGTGHVERVVCDLDAGA